MEHAYDGAGVCRQRACRQAADRPGERHRAEEQCPGPQGARLGGESSSPISDDEEWVASLAKGFRTRPILILFSSLISTRLVGVIFFLVLGVLELVV